MYGYGCRGLKSSYFIGQGHRENHRDLSIKGVRIPVRPTEVYHRRHADLESRRDVTLDPDERPDGAATFGQVIARREQHTVCREAKAHVAEEEPSHEDQQQQGDDGDELALSRCRNCQQPVELFTFLLCFGNSIVKRTERIVEHDCAFPRSSSRRSGSAKLSPARLATVDASCAAAPIMPQ